MWQKGGRELAGESGQRELEIKIQAFFDRELPEHQAAEIRRLVKDRSPEVLGVLASLDEVRGAVRGWDSSRYLNVDKTKRSVDLWSRISPEAKQIAASYRHSDSQQSSVRAFWENAKRRVQPFVDSLYHPVPAFALGAASAVVAFLAFSLDFQPGVYRSGEGRVRSGEPARTAADAGLGRSRALALSVPSHLTSGGVSFVSESNAVDSRDPRATSLDVSQLIDGRDEFDGARLSRKGVRMGDASRDGEPIQGLEADELSILWIRANSAFKLLHSKDRQAPPVIWVGRGTQ